MNQQQATNLLTLLSRVQHPLISPAEVPAYLEALTALKTIATPTPAADAPAPVAEPAAVGTTSAPAAVETHVHRLQFGTPSEGTSSAI